MREHRQWISCVWAVGACVAAGAAPGQQGAGASPLEEVVVTARLRQQSLQNVPVTVSVESGEQTRFRAIERLETLTEAIPNVFVTEGVVAETLQIRGVSGGDNSGFEQPVGQVIDGFFFSRSRLIRLPFLDVDRIEVLKGPQGALIGKNTTAGAISITSARPTDEYEAWGILSYENFLGEGDGVKFEGALSGPITDEVKARVAFLFDEGGGFLNNPSLGSAIPDAEDKVVRGIATWESTADFEATFIWNYADLFREGSNRILAFCGPEMEQILNDNAQSAFNCGQPGNLSSVVSPIDGEGNFDFFDTNIHIGGLILDWQVAGHTITSLTGYSSYDTNDWTGGDRTEFEVLNQNLQEEFEQISQEVRILSPTGGMFEYLAGVFFQSRQLDTVFSQHVNVAGSPFRGPPPFSNVSLADEEGTSVAIFGSLTWNATSNLALTVDGRFTRERKQADQFAFRGQVYDLSPANASRTLIEPVEGDRIETDFSPGFVAQWDIRPDIMVFGSVRRGFKGGGFNLSRVQPEDNFEFEEETVTAFEIGTKSSFFDNTLQANVSAFHQEFDDLQVSALDTTGGIPILTTSNAAGVDSMGVEMDVTWTPFASLVLSTAIGYNDAEYENFSNAPCFTGQTEAQGCVNGQQDLDGRDVEEAPNWTVVMEGEYTWNLAKNLDVTVFALSVWTDEFIVLQDGDPRAGENAAKPTQDSTFRLEARATIGDPDRTWTLSAIGRNLTNEIPKVGGTRLPGFLPEARQPRAQPGRSVILQAQVRF